MSLIAIPQVEGMTSANASEQLLKEMLRRNCISAYPLFASLFSSPQLQICIILKKCYSVTPYLNIHNHKFFSYSNLQFSKTCYYCITACLQSIVEVGTEKIVELQLQIFKLDFHTSATLSRICFWMRLDLMSKRHK